MVKHKKAQSGMDFLMTYGWALLIVVLIVAALFALGIFDSGTFVGTRASGFQDIGVSAWQLDNNGNLQLQLRNNAAKDVNITSITATLKTQSASYNTPIQLPNGKTSSAITITGLPQLQAGSSYEIQLQIAYTDLASGFNATSTGTITGKVV